MVKRIPTKLFYFLKIVIDACLISKKKKILANINDIESNNQKQQKEECLKYAKNQCGKHDIPQMAR